MHACRVCCSVAWRAAGLLVRAHCRGHHAGMAADCPGVGLVAVKRRGRASGSALSATSNGSPRWSGEPSSRSWSFTLASRQQDLAVGRQIHIVRRVQVLEHLLRDALKDRRRDLSALMQPDRRIENHRDRDGGIVDGREAGKRCNVLGARISSGCGIHSSARFRFFRPSCSLRASPSCRCREGRPRPASSAASPRRSGRK